jgi:bifunctional non-homologous end joining protein LigD
MMAKRRNAANDAPPIPGARRAPLPDFVKPCLALLKDKAPEGPNWIHEIKFDGYRIQARLDNGKVALLTRQALDWTEKFRPVAKAVSALGAKQAIMDGEVVSEDAHGVSSFSKLQQDLKEGRPENLIYDVFDLMYLNGRDLTPAPLEARKRALAALVAPLPKNGPIRYSESLTGSGQALFKRACQMHLEGIISKRRDAPYHAGRGGDWTKTKCSDRQELVVAGYAPSSVDPHAIGALILGYYQDGRLRYAGRVGTGYTRRIATELYRQLQPLRTDRPPFGTTPKQETRARNARWVGPRLVAEVDFRGWTRDGLVRQASFQGLREDKPAKDVVRESLS